LRNDHFPSNGTVVKYLDITWSHGTILRKCFFASLNLVSYFICVFDLA